MANKGLTMTKAEEIQRLKKLKIPQTRVSQLLGISRKTVIKYWNIDLKSLKTQTTSPEWFKELDQDYLKKELCSGVSKKLLHEELSQEYKLPSYQAFSQFIKNNVKKEKAPKVSLRQKRLPGDSMEVDYSGDSISIINPSTKELQKTELFVGVLSYSSYIYAEFTYSQKLEDFLRSHVNMFKYFGGVSRYLVVDNLKSGVTKAHNFDPDVNKSFYDLCKYYGIAVDPARAYTPQDKPVVENAVGIIQKDFFQRVRKKTYTSIYSLNQDLWDYLKLINTKVMKERGDSRSNFYKKELKFLSPLPNYDYEVFYFKKAKVHPDCHIQHEKNFYSVPYKYVGKEVSVKYNSKLVQILKGSEVLSTHMARRGRGLHSTKGEHFPEKALIETHYLIQHCLKQARLVGDQAKVFMDHLLKTPKHPLKHLRKAQSILSLEKKYGREALEKACEMALRFGKDRYQYVKSCCESYKLNLEKEKSKNNQAPIRALNLVCLQGGTYE